MKKLLVVLMILAVSLSLSAVEMSTGGELEFGTAWTSEDADAAKVISSLGDFEIEWSWQIDDNNVFEIETEMDIAGVDIDAVVYDDAGGNDNGEYDEGEEVADIEAEGIGEDGKATFYVEEWKWELNLSGVLDIDQVGLVFAVGQAEWGSEDFGCMLPLTEADSTEYEWQNEITAEKGEDLVYSIEASFAENFKAMVAVDPDKDGEDENQDQMGMMLGLIYETGKTGVEVFYTNTLQEAGDVDGAKDKVAGSDYGFVIVSAGHSMELNEEMVLGLGASYRTTVGSEEDSRSEDDGDDNDGNGQDVYSSIFVTAKLITPTVTAAIGYRQANFTVYDEGEVDIDDIDVSNIIVEAMYTGIEGLMPFAIAIIDVDSPEKFDNEKEDLNTIPAMEFGVQKTLGAATLTAGYIIANNALYDMDYYESPYSFAYGQPNENSFYISCMIEW